MGIRKPTTCGRDYDLASHWRFLGGSPFLRIIIMVVGILALAQPGQGASVSGSKTTNVTIPDAGGYVSSTISISSAPSGAVVTGVDVYFKCSHTYSSDLVVDLNADSTGSLGNRNLWNREGGSADNPSRTTTGITTFNGLSVNRTWYLYAKDFVAGDTGNIDEWTITIYYTAAAPNPPTINSPGSTSSPGTVESDLTPTFRWSSVSGATGYGLYIRDVTTNTLIYNNPGGAKSGTSFTLPSGYLSNNGHSYRWAMTSFSGSTESSQSSYRYFKTPAANQAPTYNTANQFRTDTGAAIPLAGGAVPFGVGVNFKANVSDPDGDTVKYEVELRKLPATFTGVATHSSGFVSSGSQATTTTATGLAAGNYGWKFRVVDSRGAANGWSSAGNPDFVVTSASLPGVPVTATPGDLEAPGSEIGGLTPTFSWNAVPGATGYGLYVRDLTSGDLIYDDDSVPNVVTFNIPSGRIVAGHQYRWNMRAKNGSGWGSMTGYRYFQTAAVISTLPKPQITGVSKNPVTGSDQSQPFTVTGTNFAADATVTLVDVDADYPYPNRAISSRTASSITINPVFTKLSGHWTVQVINGPGKESDPVPFDVVAPNETGPKIIGIESNFIQKKATPTVITLSGVRFDAGSIVLLISPTGQTSDIVPAEVPTATSLTFSWIFNTPGVWFVRVRSAAGILSQPETIRVLEGREQFKLSFPLAREGFSPYTAPISSVFDHSMKEDFSPDEKVVAFTGEVADIQVSASIESPPDFGKGALFSYRNSENASFMPGNGDGNYVGTSSGSTILNYDGHAGTDYSVPIEYEVIAAATGTVMSDTGYNSGNGNFVRIDHSSSGYETVYLHLSRIDVKPGDIVTEGDPIGLSGDTGKSGGPHLHFHVYRRDGSGRKISVDPYGWQGSDVDPRLAFDGLAPRAPLWRDSTPITTVDPEVVQVVSTGSSTAGSFSVGTTGGSYTASVTSGGDWLSLGSGNTGGNSGTIVVATTTNPGAARTGEVTITNSVGAVKTVSVIQEEGSSNANPTPSQIAAQILVFSQKYQIPAPVIAAVMTQESSWRQFDSNGLPLTSETSDVGIMQLNLDSSGVDAVRASRDWVYNLDEGCKILKSKFEISAKNSPSPFDSLEDENPAIFENWFYAVAWYNGEGAAAYDYVTRVWGFMRQFPFPASDYFSSIPAIGDPTRLQGFPRGILTKIRVGDPSLNESGYISRGGTSLLLLRKSGESIHSWDWTAESVAPRALATARSTFSAPLSASSIVGGVIEITDEISLVPVERTYDEWKFTPGFQIGYEGPSEDPDDDGMSNLMEFALGTSPTDKDTVLPYGIDPTQSPPVFLSRRAKHTLGVELEVEGSTDLDDWSETYVQKSLREESSSTQTWEAVLPSATQGFFRLRLLSPSEP